jgi:hypothetical protein
MLGINLWHPPTILQAEEFVEWSLCFPYTHYSSINCGDDLTSGGLLNDISEKISGNIPASYIRISDGEGNLLPLSFDLGIGSNLSYYCSSKISYIHFGDYAVISRDSTFFGGMIRDAIDGADVVGLPLIGTIKRGFETPGEDLDVRAVSGNRCSYSLRGVYPYKKKASAWFSRDLLPHYSKILSMAESIGVIATYPELAAKLSSCFSMQNVFFHKVPTQAVFIKTDDRANTNHYPKAMEQIVAEINPPKRAVYLVAAGLLGKHYCNVIKSRGGVAIDIGSVAEIWLGIQARGISREFIDKWSLK